MSSRSPATGPANGPAAALPTRFELYQNYPNPFNPTTTISFALNEPGVVTLKVFDVLGREVATLLDREAMDEGVRDVDFDATGFASGLYFYRLTAETAGDEGVIHRVNDVRKMLLVK